jgi:hypothetical protein
LIQRKQLTGPCAYSLLHTELKNPGVVFIDIWNRCGSGDFLFNE